jgi:phosphatidylinositol alpha-mannosyltransferase
MPGTVSAERNTGVARRSRGHTDDPFRAADSPQRLRIALVTEYYYPHLGGVCEHVHYFAREARRRGHHVDIITSNLRGAEPAPHVIRVGRSVPVFCNGSLARITVGLRLRHELRNTLRNGGYDLVHVHAPLSPTLPMMAIEEAEVPVVGTLHTYFERSVAYRAFTGHFQKLLNRLDAVIAVSPTAAEAHARYFDADWRIIPNGIDLKTFRPGVPRPAAIRRDIPSVLFLGRLDPRNGLATLIRSFRLLRERRRQAQLVVVGDGPLRSHYHRLAQDNSAITFVGAIRDERPGYYAHSQLYACPSVKASFGITLLESMASGTPVICSDIPGFRDVVVHEREALMTPCDDEAALADAIERLLDDDALRARLGSAGRTQARRYAWPQVTDDVLALYAKLLRAAAAA